MWILNQSKRFHNTTSQLYGIKYKYDNSTNGTADQIEFYGNYKIGEPAIDKPTMWIQLDTGDVYILGSTGIGTDTLTYKLNVNGQTYINNGASSSDALSSQLLIANNAGDNVALELWRNTNGSWQVANESANLVFKSNLTYNAEYNEGAGRYELFTDGAYNLQSLKLFSVTGAGSIPYLAVGQSAQNTDYKLYINGTTYANGRVTIKPSTSPGTYPTSTNYYGRSISPALVVESYPIYSEKQIESKSYFINNVTTSGNSTGYLLFVDNISQGRFYPYSKGEQTTDENDITTTTEGWTYLRLGNDRAAIGDNAQALNSSGKIYLYNRNGDSSTITSKYDKIDSSNTSYLESSKYKLDQLILLTGGSRTTTPSTTSGGNNILFVDDTANKQKLSRIDTILDNTGAHYLEFTVFNNATTVKSSIFKMVIPPTPINESFTNQNGYLEWSGHINNDIYPYTTATYDIGDLTYHWRHLYLSGNVYQNALTWTKGTIPNENNSSWRGMFYLNDHNGQDSSTAGKNRITVQETEITKTGTVYHYLRSYVYKQDSTLQAYLRLGATADDTPQYLFDTNARIYTSGKSIVIYAESGNQEDTAIPINDPAELNFINKDLVTGKSQSNTIIRAYNTHANNTNGMNMVIQAGTGLYIGSGESAQGLYDLKHNGVANYQLTSENAYLTSDSSIYLLSNIGTTVADRLGIQITTGGAIMPVHAKTTEGQTHTEEINDGAQDIGSASARFRYIWASDAIYAAGTRTLNAGTENEVTYRYNTSTSVQAPGSTLLPGRLEMTGNGAHIDFKRYEDTTPTYWTNYGIRIANDANGRLDIFSNRYDTTPTGSTRNWVYSNADNLTYNGKTFQVSLYVYYGDIYAGNGVRTPGSFTQMPYDNAGTLANNSGYRLHLVGKDVNDISQTYEHARLYVNTMGTTTITGITDLVLGNNKPTKVGDTLGEKYNSRGRIRYYGQNDVSVWLSATDLTTEIIMGAVTDTFTMPKLHITSTKDVSTSTNLSDSITGDDIVTATNHTGDKARPPFAIGTLSSTHLEMDNDEIIAKANAQTAGPLSLDITHLYIKTHLARTTTSYPSSNTGRYIYFTGRDSKNFGYVGVYKYITASGNAVANSNRILLGVYTSKDTDEIKTFNLVAPPTDAQNKNAYITWSDSRVGNSIIPYINDSYNLGSHDSSTAENSRGWLHLFMKGTTSNSHAIDGTNPYIEFSNISQSVFGRLIYTDQSNQGGSQSLAFVGNTNYTNTRIKAGSFSTNVAEKCAWNDAFAGIVLHADGTMHLNQGAATGNTGDTDPRPGGYIGFHYNGSTSATSYIQGRDGAVKINKLVVNTNDVSFVLNGKTTTATSFNAAINGTLFSSGLIYSNSGFYNYRISAGGGFRVYQGIEGEDPQQHAGLYLATLGTTSAEGIAQLSLGNSKKYTSTTKEDRNSTGRIIIYNKNGGSNTLTGSYGTIIGDVDHDYVATTYMKITQIGGDGVSASWHKGRDKTIFFMNQNTTGKYTPIISVKTNGNSSTEGGSWDISTYDNNNYRNQLLFTFIKDSIYDGDTAIQGPQIAFTQAGNVWAGGTVGNNDNEHQIGARSGAGSIYIYAQTNEDTSHSYRGLYTKNADDTAATIIQVKQSNKISALMPIACGITLDYTEATKTAYTTYAAITLKYNNPLDDATYTVYPLSYLGTNQATGTASNATILMGSSSGDTWVHSGEDGRALAGRLQLTSNENLYLASDGDIIFYRGATSASPYYAQQFTFNSTSIKLTKPAVDIRASNNGITADSTYYFTHAASQDTISVFETDVYKAGNIRVWWGLRNYNTSGTALDWVGMGLTQSKAGVLTWSVSGAASFRDATDTAYTGGQEFTGDIGVAKTSGPKVYVKDSTSGNGVTASIHIGTGHENHGLYSNGYYNATTGEFTSSGKWMIYRDKDGDVTVNGNSATATKWAAAQKVYVTLGTASTTTTIQGGSSSAQTIGVDGTLAIGHGGTGKTTALEAITNLGGPYLKSAGTEITASSNLDSGYKAMGTYYSANSDRTATLAGTVPTSGSGFKMITAIGYAAANLMQFLKSYNNPLMYRSSTDTGATWSKWYEFVLLPSGSDNKTFAAIGGATTPVYVNSSGIITAGTALGGAAYKAADYYSVSTHTHGNITNAGGITTAITVASNDYIIIGDNSNSGKLGKGPVFNTDNTTKWLTQAGTWTTPTASNVGALPITGGTLTGNLTISPTSSTVDYANSITSGKQTANSTYSASDTVTRTTYTGTWNRIYFQNRYKSVDTSSGSSVTSWSGARIFFRSWSATASSGTSTGKYETYYLPTATDGLSSNATYSIRTSKDNTYIYSYIGVNTESGSTTQWLNKKGGWTTPTAANVGAAASSHTHGNITNGGCITTAITIANGDYLIVGDTSDSGKIGKGPAFDASTATKCLTQKGTWATFGTSNLALGTSSTTAMKGDTVVNQVSQSATTTASWRKIVLSGGDAYAAWNTDVRSAANAVVYVAKTVSVQPSTGSIKATKVYNAVWNDYAECREVETEEPGYCVTESPSGKMIKTYKRLQPGCKITSDTFGTCMGETDTAKTPIAVAGRVLVYPYRNKIHYQLGAAVCSAPNGTVDIMSRDEIMMYPERIVGTVSEIPTYDIWHGGLQDGDNNIEVNGRIWIYVR